VPLAENEHDPGARHSKPGEGKNPEGEMTVAEVLHDLSAICVQRMIPSDDTGPGVKEAGIDRYPRATLADRA